MECVTGGSIAVGAGGAGVTKTTLVGDVIASRWLTILTEKESPRIPKNPQESQRCSIKLKKPNLMKTSDLPKTTFVCDFFFFISISKPRKGPEGNNKKRDRYIYINIFEKDLKKKKKPDESNEKTEGKKKKKKKKEKKKNADADGN